MSQLNSSDNWYQTFSIAKRDTLTLIYISVTMGCSNEITCRIQNGFKSETDLELSFSLNMVIPGTYFMYSI